MTRWSPIAGMLAVALAAGTAMAQPAAGPAATIRGRVRAAGTGQPIPGAFVSAGNEQWSRSSLSGEDGSFVIEGALPGAAEVVATADLFEPLVVRVQVTATGATLELALEEAAAEGEEIVVLTGEAPEIADPVSYDLAADEVRVLPGSGNDMLKSLQSMPGVARIPFGMGGLALRGTSPRDTNVYLDGVEVPLLYHFGGLASFYPSTMLASMELVPGGFGASYGRAQGGIVTLASRPGRRDRWRVRSEVSLTDASVQADGPGPGGGAWSLGLRRSYVDAVLAFAVPDDAGLRLTLAPRYYDGQLRYDLDLGQGQSVSAMLFGSDDRLAFVADADLEEDGEVESTRFGYVSRFTRAALRWQRRDRGVALSVTPWVGWDETSFSAGGQHVTRMDVPMGVRAELSRTDARGYLSGGLDLQGGRFSLDSNGEPPARPGVDQERAPVQRTLVAWHADLGLWLEGLYRIQKGAASVKPGLRVEHYGLTDEWVVDPRLSGSQTPMDGVTLKQSIGLYHQPPVFVDLDPVAGNPALSSSYAVQSAVGVELALPGRMQVSATGFYDQMYDVPVDVVTTATGAAEPGSAAAGGGGSISRELNSEQFGTYSYQENVGRGHNYGLESMLRGAGGPSDRAGSWLGWISYTYSRAWRRGDPARSFGDTPYVLDQPHLLTALCSVQLTDTWRVGARVRYATGNPITPVTGSYFDADTQEYRPMSGSILSQRLPAFFQLDLRMDRRWKRPWGILTLFLDIQNATNRNNAEGVIYNFDYSEVSYSRGLPVFPSVGLEYRP